MRHFSSPFAKRSALLLAAAFCFSGSFTTASAQADPGTAPQTRLDRFLSHFDLGISALGEFDTDASGTVQNTTASNGPLTVHSTSTVGVLGTIRAQKSPWVGGEFNYHWAKFTQDFYYGSNITNPVFNSSQVPNFYTGNTANEFTAGYIARPDHPILGFQPFLGGGAGTIEFKPSRGSGAGLPVQARAAYYYTVGGDRPVVGNFGVRLGFRQLFYLAPDFGQNYLTIKARQTSLEPTVGFYVHF